MSRKVKTGMGFEIEIPASYLQLKKKAEKTISSIVGGYSKAERLWDIMRGDPEVNANWDMADYITTSKLHYNDHGEVHAKIVAANALKMLKLLLEDGVLPDIMGEKAGDEDDAHLIVLAGGLLHDIGNQVHREMHNLSGVYLAIPLLNRLLPEVYSEPELMYEARGHILHTIYSHGFEIDDLTVEASLVGIADGTDMTKGRGRLAFEIGNVNIHTVSALSIERVEIERGDRAPIRIKIWMNNSAGIFQIQETLGKKISHSRLRGKVEIYAVSQPEGASTDSRIIHRLLFTEKGFEAY
ncbi:MAG TPA: phosphohydrolase [Candidatus Korarchaeota archaeon]|nr:phosphohydrolase [Candidatus Korarchaeota archaeon]